jgi:hypothetical protein
MPLQLSIKSKSTDKRKKRKKLTCNCSIKLKGKIVERYIRKTDKSKKYIIKYNYSNKLGKKANNL